MTNGDVTSYTVSFQLSRMQLGGRRAAHHRPAAWDQVAWHLWRRGQQAFGSMLSR